MNRTPHWHYSTAMLFGYLGIFHLWMHLDRPMIIVSGLLWAVAFALAAWRWHQSQFVNTMDVAAHALVILDVILEAVLIPEHNHYGFYLCAIAFSLVLGGYRLYQTRPKSAAITAQ